MNTYYSSRWLVMSLILLAASVYANDQDTRNLLERSRFEQNQHQLFNQAIPSDDAALLIIDGQAYRVGSSKAELENALYYAINLKAWAKFTQFSTRYRHLSEHNPALILLGEGLKARAEGRVDTAIRLLEQAHQSDPHNIRIELELARLYGEDYRYQDADRAFANIDLYNLPEPTRQAIDQYRDHFTDQQQWHGALALGIGYHDNINQGNGEEHCVFSLTSQCLITRKLPEPIAAQAMTYHFYANKQINLAGHHNLLLRPLSHGTHYTKKDNATSAITDYSNATTLLYAGYQYQNADHQFSILPNIEHYYRNGHSNYLAHGVEFSWQYRFSPRWQTNLQLSSKRYQYKARESALFDDYDQYSANIGTSYALTPQTWLSFNLDYTRKKYPFAPSSSKNWTWRGNLYHRFSDDFYLNTGLTDQRSTFDQATFMDKTPRKEQKSSLYISLGKENWLPSGFTPEVQFQYTRTISNNVLYQYRQKAFSLQLRKLF